MKPTVGAAVGGLLMLGLLPAGAPCQMPAQTTVEGAQKGPAESRQKVEPPDGEWLVDGDGHRYFVVKIPKGIEGRDWISIGEDRIRIRGGMPLEVVKDDGVSFSVKIYEIPAPTERSAPTSTDVAAAPAMQDVSTVVRDRLRFTPFDRGLPRQGQWRNGFDVGDMNGDGQVDLVFGPARKGEQRLSVFLGDGHGTWRLWIETDFPDLPYDYGDAAVADFDGDGHLDMALAMHLSGLLVLRGDGAGHFTAWSDGLDLIDPADPAAESAFSSRAIVTVDWNADGRPDLLALGEGMGRASAGARGFRSPAPAAATGAAVFVNRGDGSWQTRHVPSPEFGDSIAAGDLNGDKRPDFVTAAGSMGGRRILHFGTADDTWETGAWETAELELPPDAWIRAVAAADLDGDASGNDGRDEILVGYLVRADGISTTGIDVYSAGSEGWERHPLHAERRDGGIYALAVGDLDGDGRRDVAAATGDGEILVFLADGDGGFTREESPELPAPVAGCSGYDVELIDLDGDGRDEMIAAFAGEAAGYQGFGGEPGCPGQGSLRAWTTETTKGTTE